MQVAERNAVRLKALINDILDLERLERGRLDMRFDGTGLGDVLQRAVETTQAMAAEHGVSLEAPPAAGRAWADADRLTQVLVNLLSNAIKFSPAGSVVTVTVREIPDWVEVRVVDRGRGIPAEHRDLIFQRFRQISASDAREKSGTGLGLAICKNIIEQHGGLIGVESGEGRGSAFWFLVPPAVARTPGAPPPG